MSEISRRNALAGGAALIMSSSVPLAGLASAQQRKTFQLLRPERMKGYPAAPGAEVAIAGFSKAGYLLEPSTADQSPRRLILYFHGTGGGFRAAIPPEYPLLDEGFVIVMPLRPGYTDSSSIAGANCIDNEANCRPNAEVTARAAAALLSVLKGGDKWSVPVIGMSGGGPTALAFASIFPQNTRALILQAAVTHPWWHQRYVPHVFGRDYEFAVREHQHVPDISDRFSRITDSLGARIVQTARGERFDAVLAVVGGKRINAVKRDLAGEEVLNTQIRTDYNQDRGRYNDFQQLFRSPSEFCEWRNIVAPTLIIHDPKDPFVPFAHALVAKRRIRNAMLATYRLGGHMVWLGDQAKRMHARRLQFLRQNA